MAMINLIIRDNAKNNKDVVADNILTENRKQRILILTLKVLNYKAVKCYPGQLNLMKLSCSELLIISFGQFHFGSNASFILDFLNLRGVNSKLSRGKDRSLNKLEVSIVDKASEEPDERLIVLVVTLGRDIVVLEVLLSVESNLFSLNFTILNINLVSNKNNWDRLTDTSKILVPLRYVSVSNSRADIEHDNSTVSTNVVTITESSKLFLTCGIPNVELDLSMVGKERHRMYLNTEGGDVFLLKLTSEMTFDESGFTDTTISNENELELGNLLLLIDHSI